MTNSSARFLLLASLLATPAVSAQDGDSPHRQEEKPQRQDEKKEPKKSLLDEADELFGEDAQLDELVELFHEVERTLIDIDDRLYEAAASGDLESVADAGLEKLLRDTREQSESVVAGIDRILEVASQMSSSSSSGSGTHEPSQTESPLESQRDKGPMQRERTPEAPKPKDQGESEGEKQAKPEDPKAGEEPERPGGRDSKSEDGENRKGSPKSDERGEAGPRSDDTERWGELPQRVKDTFRTQGRGDLPALYRDWIDAYYRRLNRRR